VHVCTAPDDHAVAAAPAVVSRRQPSPPAGQDPDTEVMALCIGRFTVRQVTMPVRDPQSRRSPCRRRHRPPDRTDRSPQGADLPCPGRGRRNRGPVTTRAFPPGARCTDTGGRGRVAVGARRMTTPYFADDAATLYTGDAVEVLSELPDGGADLVVTSPRTGDCATTAPAGGLVAIPRAYIRPGGTPSASPGRTAVRNRSCRRGVCSQALAVSSPGVRWRH
jgi:hypothetical protein